MATTPPPSELRIPPTPRHGPGYDSYEPYAPRHSARLASQRSRERRSTPPPSLPNEQAREFRKGTRKQGDTEAGALSPSESIHGSPRKDQLGRPGGCVPTHSLDNAPSSVNDNNNPSDPFDSESTHLKQPFLHEFRTTITNGMLPTPAKTPRKKAVGDVSAASRTLFPSSSTPGRGKKGKKPSAFSLDCFGDEPSGSRTRIEIYTDSRDRIPEVHEHEGNPFYKKPDEKTAATVTRNSAVRPSRRRMVEEVKRDKEVEEAFERDDGMVYVFRGRKVFRKFQDDAYNGQSDDDDDDNLGLLAAHPDLIDPSIPINVRPLTRSSIKPRVLFPSARSRESKNNHASDADEEAATDIEDHVLPQEDSSENIHQEDSKTPEQYVTPHSRSTVATPASPGATTRSLRPRQKHEASSHHETPTTSQQKRKHASPFDGWLRKKQVPTGAVSKSKKRDAGTVSSPGGPATKKSRGTRASATSVLA